jgi:glycosyltransferase involved in cell wall biosynthesis
MMALSTNAPDSNPPQKWIGVFQADWPIQKHTLYLLNGLAEEGYHVDLFCFKTLFIHLPKEYCKSDSIHVHDLFPHEAFNQLYKSLPAKVKRHFRRLASGLQEKFLLFAKNYERFIPKEVVENVFRIVQGKYYVAFIGIEKLGLVWASQVAKNLQKPYLYYSLELYTSQHPLAKRNDFWRRLKVAETYSCKQSVAIIIQDEKRAELLLKDNQLKSHPIIYLPISLPGEPCCLKKSNYLREKFLLSDDKVLLLQFGKVTRYGEELIKLAQTFPDNYVLVLHDGLIGNLWNYEELIVRFKELDYNHKVIFSLEDLNDEQTLELVASADAGLVLYTDRYDNDRLTIFSSEKIALYLKCGLPIIGFRYPGYDLLEATKSGVLIDAIEEIPDAVRGVIDESIEYRKNAQKLFVEKYKFEKNFQELAHFLGESN